MKTKLIVSFLFLTFGLSYGQTKNKKPSELSWRLMLKHRTSLALQNEHLQMSELKIDPEVTWNINRNMKLYTQVRYYAEFTDNLEPGKNNISNYSSCSKPILLNDYSQLELRELYLDTKLGKSYWRIGKQQIVWGQTEGIKVLDVINPMTWREFILEDFDDSRIPLWSVKTDFSVGKVKIQGIWIPDLTYHQIPGSGGLFSRNIEVPPFPEGIQLEINDLDKPSNAIKDSDIGGKISSFIKGWDLSLSYLYHYDDVPVDVRSFSYSEGQNPLLFITPSYKRSSLIGFTFANTMGNFALRGELGFAPAKSFSSMSLNAASGIFKSDQLTSGVALDYFGISETLVTVQWFGDIVMDKGVEDHMSRDQALNYVTVMVSRTFLNQKLDAKVFTVYGVNDSDGLIDMKTSYQLNDNLKISLAGDVFFGKRKSIIGQFGSADRIVLGIEFGLQ